MVGVDAGEPDETEADSARNDRSARHRLLPREAEPCPGVTVRPAPRDRRAGRRRHLPRLRTEPLEHRKSPWYFKFMLVASVIYLGYRAFQGVTWVVHHV